MSDSLQNSPFEDVPKRRKGMIELRSGKLVGPSTPKSENPPDDQADLSSLSLNKSVSESSSLQDVEASIDGDAARRSVEREEFEDDPPSEDQSTSSRRNSSLTDPTPPTPRKESPKFQPESAATAQNSNFCLLAVAIVAICLGVAFAISSISPPAQKPQHCDQFVTELRPKYPTIDPMLWTTLNVSVNRAVYSEPGEPSTFVFLYDSATVQRSLVEDIVRITSQCFHGTRGPIRLTSADFATPEIAADYSAFLQRYRQPLEERGIMVVQDLDQVPAKAARALFTICDSYGPLVERAVIFFTIDISRRAPHDPDQSPTALAEKLLEDQWRDGLREDTLKPLLVRLTENVFTIM